MKWFWIALGALALPVLADVPDPDPARFAKDIKAFDLQDEEHPSQKGGVVFTGSSSIRMLKIPEVFPGLKALNRGFGGSQISDLNHYLDRVLLRYEPSVVVFYCGTNDLWKDKPVPQVEEDFEEFRNRLFKVSPQAELIIIPVRPSPRRASIRKQEDALNKHFAKIADGDERITYLPELVTRYLKPDGSADPKYFIKDRLHMNAAGYEVWSEVLGPLLKVEPPVAE